MKKEKYEIEMYCYNCGSDFTAKISKGNTVITEGFFHRNSYEKQVIFSTFKYYISCSVCGNNDVIKKMDK